MKRSSLLAILAALFLLWIVDAQSKPEIHVSPDHVKSGDSLLLMGSGFTPNRTALSHLLRPNGSEYHPLRLKTDQHGQFYHRIDTVMLDVGTFEVWVEDEAAKMVSARVRFTVE